MKRQCMERDEHFGMDHVLTARTLFGTTMAFHIIFATLGVGIPLMILLAELLYQKRKTMTMPLWQIVGQKRSLFCLA